MSDKVEVKMGPIDTKITDAVEADRHARSVFGNKEGTFLVLTDKWSMSDKPWAVYWNDEETGERAAAYIAGPIMQGEKLVMIPCSLDGKSLFNLVAFRDEYALIGIPVEYEEEKG